VVSGELVAGRDAYELAAGRDGQVRAEQGARRVRARTALAAPGR
jgi:hypothetical protein